MTSLIIDWLFYWGYYAWRTPLWLRWLRICLQWRRPGFDPWIRKIPRRREWLPTPVFLTGISHGQRSLVGYSPWGRKESDTTEQLTHTHTHTHMLHGQTGAPGIQRWRGWNSHLQHHHFYSSSQAHLHTMESVHLCILSQMLQGIKRKQVAINNLLFPSSLFKILLTLQRSNQMPPL